MLRFLLSGLAAEVSILTLPGSAVLAGFLLPGRSVNDDRWEPVTKGEVAGFVFGLAGLLLLLFWSEPGFVFLIDHANLLFHEAGHPMIGVFSSRLEPYGGTAGQLTFPVILAVSFWRKGRAIGVAASLLWFFENWFNIARYMADARSLQLPLVGGGDHDWNTILSRWGLLQWDTRIASVVAVLAWTGIVLTCAWFAWQAWMGTRLRSSAEAETARPFAGAPSRDLSSY